MRPGCVIVCFDVYNTEAEEQQQDLSAPDMKVLTAEAVKDWSQELGIAFTEREGGESSMEVQVGGLLVDQVGSPGYMILSKEHGRDHSKM